MILQPRRRQVVSGGTGRSGSSDSDIGGVDGRAGGSVVWGTWFFEIKPEVSLVVEIALNVGFEGLRLIGFLGGARLGVSSMMECLPVVQGGMERNSSKVKTRGLQQFHPVHVESAICSS